MTRQYPESIFGLDIQPEDEYPDALPDMELPEWEVREERKKEENEEETVEKYEYLP